MAKFVYLYLGGAMRETPEEQEKAMQAWGTWLGSLGPAVVEIGNPFGASATVQNGGISGPATTGASGYTVVTADSLDAAADLAKGCPIHASGGRVEVFEAIEM